MGREEMCHHSQDRSNSLWFSNSRDRLNRQCSRDQHSQRQDLFSSLSSSRFNNMFSHQCNNQDQHQLLPSFHKLQSHHPWRLQWLHHRHQWLHLRLRWLHQQHLAKPSTTTMET